MKTVNLENKFASFTEHWKPKVLGDINDFQVKAVKLKGEFVWHHHDREDEMFLVVKGVLRMKFRDREARVGPGEFMPTPDIAIRETDKLAGQLLTLDEMRIHYLEMESWSQIVYDRLTFDAPRLC